MPQRAASFGSVLAPVRPVNSHWSHGRRTGSLRFGEPLPARKAERDNPPAGRFLTVNGVRLHYVERGSGEPLILLYGNGSMFQDFEASGLIDLAARKFRVVVLDRPGYGHSNRSRTTIWTPEAQADLIHGALARLGIERATILGHSWGCSVAVALAHKYPGLVAGLVLASGYYYPTARADVIGMAAPAVPVVGNVVRYTISPILSRLMWPLLMGQFSVLSGAKKILSLPQSHGGPAVAHPRERRGIGTGDSGCLRSPQHLLSPEDACRHSRRCRRPYDRR